MYDLDLYAKYHTRVHYEVFQSQVWTDPISAQILEYLEQHGQTDRAAFQEWLLGQSEKHGYSEIVEQYMALDFNKKYGLNSEQQLKDCFTKLKQIQIQQSKKASSEKGSTVQKNLQRKSGYRLASGLTADGRLPIFS